MTRLGRGSGRYASDFGASDFFASEVAAGFSDFPSPSLELAPDSPSLAPGLRPPRPGFFLH